MRAFSPAAAVLALGLLGICQALNVTILADTNRDGKVDVTGQTDIQGKTTWTDDRGALFLANIGDTNQRCSVAINDSMPNSVIDKCHDASDNVQRNPKYLAPLKSMPCLGLSNSAKGHIHVSGTAAAERVRIFRKESQGWAYVAPDYAFSARDLTASLDLGIDARDVRRPGVWDGRVTVHLSIQDGTQSANDSVALRVAPVLTHHHLQVASQVLTTASASGQDPQSQFVKDLGTNAANAGITKPVFTFQDQDIWTQDFFEPGYSSIPGPHGAIMLRVMIRSTQSDRPAGRLIFSKLRSDTIGAVQYLKEGYGESIESTGNLETIPPHRHNGKFWPAGRTIMGSYNGMRPYMVNFLDAQEVQLTVSIDTSWLMVGHTDEFLQFLPANNERGWVMMACDPIAGLEILKKASAAGLGGLRALSRPSFPTDNGNCLPNNTITDVLNRGNLTSNFTSIQTYAAKNIQANIDIIKRETGLTDDEIIRVPSLFYTDSFYTNTSGCPGQNDAVDVAATMGPKNIALAGAPHSRAKMLRRRKLDDGVQVEAFYPGTVNGLVLSNSQVLAPNPWGPLVNGKDIIAEAVTAAYRKINYTVVYQDDWFSHHLGDGEVHCGSNSIRDPSTPWWQMV